MRTHDLIFILFDVAALNLVKFDSGNFSCTASKMVQDKTLGGDDDGRQKRFLVADFATPAIVDELLFVASSLTSTSTTLEPDEKLGRPDGAARQPVGALLVAVTKLLPIFPKD